MNKTICEGCRRFDSASDGKYTGWNWYCAKEVWLAYSKVIPGHQIYERDKLQPMRENAAPPTWCEYITEQTVSTAEDNLKVQPFKQPLPMIG